MSWIFAPLYDRIMAGTEEACLRAWRTDLLQQARGNVLEIGAGTGANIDLYPATVQSVTFCEPDPGMRHQLEAKLAATSRAFDTPIVDAPGESLPFGDATFDTLVSTLVLCTVGDVDATLRELRRVARHDATLIFLEHVAAEDGSVRRFAQRAAEPLWKRVAGNCHLTRDTAHQIGEHFEIEQLTAASMRKAFALVRPTVRGLARPRP